MVCRRSSVPDSSFTPLFPIPSLLAFGLVFLFCVPRESSTPQVAAKFRRSVSYDQAYDARCAVVRHLGLKPLLPASGARIVGMVALCLRRRTPMGEAHRGRDAADKSQVLSNRLAQACSAIVRAAISARGSTARRDSSSRPSTRDATIDRSAVEFSFQLLSARARPTPTSSLSIPIED